MIPDLLYKDDSYYPEDPKKIISTQSFYSGLDFLSESMQINFLQFTWFKNEQDGAILYKALEEFIRDDAPDYLQIESPNEPTTQERYCDLFGTRLFKIPTPDFTDDLTKLRPFKRLQSYESVEYFLNHFVAVEIAPNGYLEIYAAHDSLRFLFLEQLYSLKLFERFKLYCGHYPAGMYSLEEIMISPYSLGSSTNLTGGFSLCRSCHPAT